MSTYHRYQPIFGTEQHLYCDGCPVYVHRYQISADLQTGDRILQVRMVNMSEWEVSSVYLRIACLDEQGRALATMYAVPMNNLNAARGGIFGESCTLRLSTAATQLVQVFPERVVFSNGMIWNETERASYVTLPAPIPVKRTDVDFDRLELQGQCNGVHNDYRYQELENAWYCTCGLPNAQRRQFCGYCGTNREWLRLNMNGRAAIVHMEPTPSAPQAPAAPKPEIQTSVQPEPPSVPSLPMPGDASVAELLDYMNRKMEQYSAPVSVLPEQNTPQPEEFPFIEPMPPKRNRAGKIIGIFLLVLAIAATVAFCVLRFLLPQLRYGQANNLEQMGSYAEAREIFTELGDYQDAPDRVTGTWYREAQATMGQGDYETAYQIFVSLSGFENSNGHAADCLYSLGVLAFNAGDTDGAWGYVQRLQTEFPDYEGGEALYQSCCYAFGNASMTDGEYEEAESWFVLAGTYQNADELIQYCNYQAACAARDEGDYAVAAELFRVCTYGDSAEQVKACMLLYVQNDGERKDQQTIAYLKELCDAKYSGAAELYEQLYGWRVKILVSTEAKYSAQTKECQSTDELNKLYLHYSLTGGPLNETMSILVIYTLPNEATGKAYLVTAGSDGNEGTLEWKELKAPECKSDGTLNLKFCNAETGEELYSCSIEIKAAE